MQKILENKENKLLNLNVTIFSILLISTILYAFPSTKVIGALSLVLLLLLSFFYFVTNLSRIKVSKTFLAWLAYACYGLFVLLINFSMKSAYIYVEQVAILFFVTMLSQSSLNINSMNRLSGIFKKLLYIIIGLVMISQFLFELNGIETIFYKMFLMCAFFAMIKTKNIFVLSAITIFFLFITSTRSSILTIVLFLIIYFLCGKLKESKRLYKLTFLVITIIILIIPIAYVSLKYMPLGIELNTLSRELFNKNFFSGRDIIWDVAFMYIKESLYFGYGFSNDILVSNYIMASTHNIFINLLLQGGVVLLILFIYFMYTLWMGLFQRLDNKTVRISASFLLPIMLRASFDLILLENDLILSINMWIIICVGLIISNNLNRNEKQIS